LSVVSLNIKGANTKCIMEKNMGKKKNKINHINGK
jgi:hypothetical protein